MLFYVVLVVASIGSLGPKQGLHFMHLVYLAVLHCYSWDEFSLVT